MNKNLLFFVSDLHGKESRYEKLFQAIKLEKPGLVLVGGDILPSGMLKNILKQTDYYDFLGAYLKPNLKKLKHQLGDEYPCLGVILGNDDPRSQEEALIQLQHENILHYLHFKKIKYQDFTIAGYSFVPPTPFRLKDWERYDVSRFVDHGSLPPDEGFRTIEISYSEIECSTIQKDLALLTEGMIPQKTIMLFHAPPYDSWLDRAALDGIMFGHVPLDVHVGSIAIQRFIADKQPFITLHGHIHESSRITGHWKQYFGDTKSFSAAYDGEELSLVKIDLSHPENALRELL